MKYQKKTKQNAKNLLKNSNLNKLGSINKCCFDNKNMEKKQNISLVTTKQFLQSSDSEEKDS